MFLLPPPICVGVRATRALQRHRVIRFCSALTTPAAPAQNSRPRSATRCRDVVKRKVALMVGYDGAKYHGLQRNAGVETVSDVLEKALHASGAISDDNVGFLEKIKWQNAARTDRGVSAAGNVISAKLLFRKEEQEGGDAFERTTERVNANLPEEVRLFGIKYVTNSFSARTSCGERWYEYFLPLSALDTTHSLESFRAILNRYEGAHSFHNYTVGVDHLVPPRQQANRYITKATCDLEPVVLSGLAAEDLSPSKWVRIRVRGQSFLLHQIRKMVSLAILTHNNRVPGDAIEQSFSLHTLINVPPAPAVGLFLDCCHFKWYNERHKAVLPEPVSFSRFDVARETFKREHIFPSISRRAAEENALLIYNRTTDSHPVEFS